MALIAPPAAPTESVHDYAATRTDSVEIGLRPDASGRTARKLRIQITDACNLRCVYCMPEHATFAPPSELLRPYELAGLCASLRALGITEARITGGEPTVRADFLACVEAIASVGWHRLGLTTNGLRMVEFSRPLAGLGVQGANISLDSLQPDGFRRISRREGLDKVLSGIDAARAAGLTVKINCVAMRGVNESELPAFVEYSAREGIEVRFLEAMRVGPLAAQGGSPLIPSAELRGHLESIFGPARRLDTAPDATASLWMFPNGARIGFVASETEPFCGNCSRLRLSARGNLRSCLFRPEGPSLRGLSGNELAEAVSAELATKPSGRILSQAEDMNAIGG